MSDSNGSLPRASFRRMVDGTPEEWAAVGISAVQYNKGLADRVLTHLKLLTDDFGGYAVTRLEHCLQTATRAHRDGRDEEYVVCALLHDIGDTLGSFNHADIAAAVLKPFVSEENLFMVEKHAVFQGYYFFEHFGLDKNARDAYRGHPLFSYTAEFCAKYDQCSFDPAYPSMKLEEFEPMVRSVMKFPKRSIYVRERSEAASEKTATVRG
jgi:predicted HD phosphohydrolase